MADQSAHPETLALHAGWRADPATGAVAPPIYQTTSYQFHDTAHAADLFALKEFGNIYTRIGNPTTDILEQRIAAHRRRRRRAGPGVRAGRVGVRGTKSRRAPATISSAPPTFMAARGACSPTRSRIWASKRASSIPADPDNFVNVTDERTRAYYAETLPNPKLEVFPIAEVAAIGRPLGIPLIMDNTAAPLIARPFDHGAAIIVYSSTKYLGGHGTSIGGLIVDGGNFEWAKLAEAPTQSSIRPILAIMARSGRRRPSRSARSPTSSARASYCCAISARR